MVYPRACPSCQRSEPSPEQLYSTRAAMDGGTPSPFRPELPGRVLDLRCGACWALFRWDYFGSSVVEILAEGNNAANGHRTEPGALLTPADDSAGLDEGAEPTDGA